MSKGIFPKNNQFCFGTPLKVDGCSFVRSYHFIKKYTPGNHTTDLGNISYRKNAFFRALPEKGGGGPCPNLSFIYIQHISSENIILKTFWYFGAPYSAGKCLRGSSPSMQMSGTRASYTLKRCFCFIYLFNIRWISCGTLRRLWDQRPGQWTPLACSGRKGFNLNACIFVQDYHQYLLNVSFVVANVDPLRKGKIPQPRRLGSLIKIIGPLYVLLHVLYKLFYL